MFLNDAGPESEILVRSTTLLKSKERALIKDWVKANGLEKNVTLVEEIFPSEKVSSQFCRNEVCIAANFNQLFVPDQFPKWNILAGLILNGDFDGFNIPIIDDVIDLDDKIKMYLPLKMHKKNLIDVNSPKVGRTMPACSLENKEEFLKDIKNGVYTVSCVEPEFNVIKETYDLFKVNGNVLETV
jgi:hypothetical protein